MQRKLVVTTDTVGVILDVAEGDAATEIAAARDFIRGLSDSVPEPKPQPRQRSTPLAKTLSGRILALGSSYFVEPRESTAVAKDLARSGFHYEDVRVRVELGRMVQRGLLRRIGDGTKMKPYKYVNR
jgi:hypothetical protein